FNSFRGGRVLLLGKSCSMSWMLFTKRRTGPYYSFHPNQKLRFGTTKSRSQISTCSSSSDIFLERSNVPALQWSNTAISFYLLTLAAISGFTAARGFVVEVSK